MSFIVTLSILAKAKLDRCKAMLHVPLDPWQYEGVDQGWLERHLETLELRARWGKLRGDDAEDLDITRKELHRRIELARVIGNG